MSLTYLDFDVEISPSTEHHYTVAVRSHAGQVRQMVAFPFKRAELETHLVKVENALLRSASTRRKNLTPSEDAVQTFGQQLFDFLLSGELLSQYRECQREADHQHKGVRWRLHIQAPLLATLPWEFLYDPRKQDYVCLDPNTPLVRYMELPQTPPPLAVPPPLRILGVIAAPAVPGQTTSLQVDEEKQRVLTAVRTLEQKGLMEVTWLDGQTALDLQRAMRRGPWHIVHFIGHGGFDVQRAEGLLWLADEAGQPEPLYATQLARLLAIQRSSLRLVLLNSCEGARNGAQDLLASTAATLVNSGIPAVLAMQYEITDRAAVQFARTFYEALTDNLPVDAAVADARNAINLRDRFSLEWGTPVLYMRALDGYLFNMRLQVNSLQDDLADSELLLSDNRNNTIEHNKERADEPLEFEANSIRLPQFRRRDSVRHSTFGDGTVIESTLTKNDEEVTVAFPGVGIKKLLASLAGLKKLNQSNQPLSTPFRSPHFKRRDSVRHSTFGDGTVVGSNLTEKDEEVLVAFPGVGIKKLLASLANLEKL